MSKVLVTNVKVDDFIEIDSPGVPGWSNRVLAKGFVRTIKDYRINPSMVTKVIELYTEKGIVAYYLQLTEEVVNKVVSPEEKHALLTRTKVKSLRRVVDRQGSDPEMFVVNKDNIVIPSFKFLKDKKNPDMIPENNQAMFWDGYQAEFNIPGDSCLDRALPAFWHGLKHLNRLAKKYDKDARLTIQPTLDIPPHMLREDKEEHVQFGCMPSLNVYGMEGSKVDGRDVPFRSAGGHIHLQLKEEQKKRIPEYVKALDAILGVASVSMFGSLDDARRRELYGLAGEYRTPKHGMEYRVLSNAWLCHPTLTYITFELARKVITLVDEGLFHNWVADERDTIAAINDCDIPLANEILKQNEEMFKDILYSFSYQKETIAQAIYNIYMFGVENLVKNVDDIEKNWGLGNSNFDYACQIRNLESSPAYKKIMELKNA